MRASTNSYLYLMRRAIEDSLMPELHSEDAQRTARILLGSIDELVRRETVMPAVLAQAIPAGAMIARHIHGLLSPAVTQSYPSLDAALGDLCHGISNTLSFAELRVRYLKLESILEKLLLPCLEAAGNARLDSELASALGALAQWKKGILERQLAPLAPESTHPTAAFQPLTADKLQIFLRSCLPAEPDLEVLEFSSLSGGMSKQTYGFKLKRRDGTVDDLVVRKTSSEPYMDFGCIPLHREFDFVRCLSDQGYPGVPEPLWLARDLPGVSGDFYVMRKAEGTNTGGIFSNVVIPEPILLQIAEAMAALHRTPLSAFRGFIERNKDPRLLEDTVSESVRRMLLGLIDARKSVSRTGDSGETCMLAWALANIPRNDAPPSPLHGDFTPHNCLWHDGRLTAIIDWECADFGDPVADLAYIQPHIVARMDWNVFLAHYEKHFGAKINQDSLAYYSVLLHTRTSVFLNVISTRIENRQAASIVSLDIDHQYVPMIAKLSMDVGWQR